LAVTVLIDTIPADLTGPAIDLSIAVIAIIATAAGAHPKAILISVSTVGHTGHITSLAVIITEIAADLLSSWVHRGVLIITVSTLGVSIGVTVLSLPAILIQIITGNAGGVSAGELAVAVIVNLIATVFISTGMDRWISIRAISSSMSRVGVTASFLPTITISVDTARATASRNTSAASHPSSTCLTSAAHLRAARLAILLDYPSSPGAIQGDIFFISDRLYLLSAGREQKQRGDPNPHLDPSPPLRGASILKQQGSLRQANYSRDL